MRPMRERTFESRVWSSIANLLALGIFGITYWLWHDVFGTSETVSVGAGVILALSFVLEVKDE